MALAASKQKMDIPSERERILYKNFVQVGQDVKEMIKDVQNKRGAK